MADGFSLGSWGRLATRWCLEELFDLLRPFHVICPRLLACQGLDNVLQASPEAHPLQRVVEPARGDAEVGLVGETWWMRWCLRGRMTCQSCRKTTQHGSPKYVCDHLWIWLVKVPKMIRQKTKHSQGTAAPGLLGSGCGTCRPCLTEAAASAGSCPRWSR